MLMRLVFSAIAISFLSCTLPCQVIAQNGEGESKRSRLHILTSDGEVAVGAKVFVGISGRITIFGNGDQLKTLGRENVDYALRSADGKGIDLTEILTNSSAEKMADMDGMSGMAGMPGGGDEMEDMMSGMGMESGNRLPVYSAFYYAMHPEHGFAFVPRQAKPASEIRLRPSAKLHVHVPNRYAADEYVVLACWMNRYADPVCDRNIQYATDFEDMGMMMGGGMDENMGMGMGGDMMGMGGPSDEVLGGRYQDWRLQTMVTHWQVVELVDAPAESKDATLAVINVPPGEVRITLVPKSAVERCNKDPKLLEHMLFFGGPTQLVMASSSASDSQHRSVNLPDQVVRDLEFTGSTTGTGLPDWVREESTIFLSEATDQESRPIRVSSERDAILIAGSRRTERSNTFLGRIAHQIAPNRYLAIGVPLGSFEVCSAKTSVLEKLTLAVKHCQSKSDKQLLQPLAFNRVGTSGEEPAERSPRPRRSRGSSRSNMLNLPVDKPVAELVKPSEESLRTPTERFVFQIGPSYQSIGGAPRKLLNLTDGSDSPLVGDPRMDELAIYQNEKPSGDRSQDDSVGAVPGTMPAAKSDAAKVSLPDIAERNSVARIVQLRRRIEKLEYDVKNAKGLLERLEAELRGPK